MSIKDKDKDKTIKKVLLKDLRLGDKAEISKIMSLELIKAFESLSDDHNPLHLDYEFAAKSRYKKQIMPGMLVSSLFSGLFGSILPGEGCVYKSQSLKFKRPIFLGDNVTARIEITLIKKEEKVVKFDTVCLVNKKIMIDGEAEIFIP